jgi:hypothetical protein
MSRKILYPAIALIAAQSAGMGPNDIVGGFHPESPVVFVRPFNAALQQHTTQVLRPIPNQLSVEGVYAQPPDVFAKPFPASEQQFSAHDPRAVPDQLNVEGVYFQSPDVFAKPFPAHEQQFNSFQPQGFVKSTFPDGWRSYQWEYRFAKPFPVAEQQFSTYFKFPPGVVPQGWYPHEPEVFAKPFPVTEQSFQPVREPVPPPPPGFGWWGYQFNYAFTKPFNAALQQFQAWDLVGAVPPNLPPGAGKRYKKPTDYLPEPPWDVKPNKPFRPVWDKPKGGEIEQPAKVATPAGPPPLPPASIFGPPGYAQRPALNLPNFNNYAPQDPHGLAQRMNDAQDLSDAVAVLKALGLISQG